MIDPENEDLILLAQACKEKIFRDARTRKPCHVASIHRYVLRGARSSTGERVYLETILTPRGKMTSREAITRFINRLNGLERGQPPASMRKKQIEAAEAELAAAGMTD